MRTWIVKWKKGNTVKVKADHYYESMTGYISFTANGSTVAKYYPYNDDPIVSIVAEENLG